MKRTIEKIIGDKNSFTLEHRMFNMSAVAGGAISILAFIVNWMMNFSTLLIFAPLIMFFLTAYLYYLSMYKGKYRVAASFILLVLIIFLYPVIWIQNAGIKGPVELYFLLNVILIAILLNKSKYYIVLVLNFVVLLTLNGIEYFYPNIIIPYVSKEAMVIDNTISMVIVTTVTFFMVFAMMRDYNDNIEELNRAYKTLKIKSETDDMTGIYNRKYIMNTLEELLLYHQNEMAVLMLDIDHFKSINDRFGHGVGDEVIIAIASTMESCVRKSDFVGRIGGEEFFVILPDCNKIDAKIIAENIRKSIFELEWKEKGLETTISIGVYLPSNEEVIETILKNVDSMLYEAKNSGRNKVIYS